MTRDELIAAVRTLGGGKLTESALHELLQRMVAAVPHAMISDLIYYPERERSGEQIVDEALLREKIWTENGESALRSRIEAQMRAALADESTPQNHHTKLSAQTLLETCAARSAS
jgi:hypothetical protein